MKMNFSKDELAMVYQYAAGTKEETLAGLKEIFAFTIYAIRRLRICTN